MKNIIAFWGKSNIGKTATIRKLISLFQNHYPTAKYNWYDKGYDHKLMIEVDGKKIGIESQGDPTERQKASVKFFAEENCDLIVCASRTRGETVQIIEQIAEDYNYDLTWLTPYQTSLNHNDLNQLCAEHIFQLVRCLLEKK